MNTTVAEKYNNTSRTVLALFNISMPDKTDTLPLFKIASMIAGLLNSSPTPSQVIIRVMLRGKKLIRHFTDLTLFV